MLDAYENNDSTSARELAMRYLNDLKAENEKFLLDKTNYLNREGAVHRALTLIRHILLYEYKIEPAKRFGRNADFMELIEQALVGAEENFTQLNKIIEYSGKPNQSQYLQKTLAYCVREWIRIRKNIIPREELLKSFIIFKSDLSGQGYVSFDEVVSD